MNRKASAGVIFGIIFVIIVICVIIAGIIFLTQRGYLEPKDDESGKTMRLLIRTGDVDTDKSVSANYVLYDPNQTIVSQGVLDKDETREIKIRPEPHLMVCWSEDYYLVKGYKQFHPVELEANVSSFSCDMEKIEKDVKISHTGEISGELSQINLNITAQEKLQRVGIAIAYTSGFQEVYAQEQLIECESGTWKNYTSFNETTQEYDYLEEGRFACGDDEIEECNAVVGNKCKTEDEKVPLRLKNTHDVAFYTGRSIEGESLVIPIMVRKSEFANTFDEIEIIVYDYDRRWNSEEQRYLWYSEYEGNDIGARDKKYIISYGGNS